jgi:upstream activation factor subunit UAF30
MKFRSGKTYVANSSSKEKNNIKLNMKVDNHIALRMQTRSGKTYNANSYSMEKNNNKLEMKVDNVVNRTSEPIPISTDRRQLNFTTPSKYKISYELANFLGKSLGTEMSRVDVSHHINNYIRFHNLDQENGQVINPDSKLRSLLKLGENDELTYFNLQKYMKPHFYRE